MNKNKRDIFLMLMIFGFVVGAGKIIDITKDADTNTCGQIVKFTQAVTMYHLYDADGNPITATPDMSGKADKVTGATNGNFAGLDATGNLTDSGAHPADYAAAASVANAAKWDQSYSDTTAATDENTINTIIRRDGSGNFSAGTITASLNGNASTASTAGSVALANVALGGGTVGSIFYGDATNKLAELTPGASGTILQTNGAGAAPSWTDSISSSNIGLSEIGTASYDDLTDWNQAVQSAGIITGGEIADDGDGTITVSAGSGIIKSTNSAIGANYFFNWTATALSPVDETVNYVYVDYNSGTPIVSIGSSNVANGHTIFNLGKVFREGTSLDILDSGIDITDFSKRNQQRLVERYSIEFISGAAVSATGTRNIALTSGVMYTGLNRITTDAFDSSGADTFEYYYYTGSAWTESSASQINNTQYNNIATGLATLSNNKYGVHWVFKGGAGKVYVLYGQGDYTLVEAKAAAVPASLPSHVEEMGILRAKIIILKSAVAFTEISNVTNTSFSYSTASNHNELAGLQGGTADQYYHSTLAQYTGLASLFTASQGSLFYTSATGTVGILPPGTANYVLKTGGAGANPSWTVASAGIGGATGSTDNALIRADGTGGATIQGSSATMDDSGSLNVPTGQGYKINNTTALWNPLAAYNIVLGAGGASLAHGAGDTGYYNTLGGYDSGTAMTSGYNNSGWGANVLKACTTGNRNSAWGRYALGSLTEGIHNNALGYACLYFCTTGNYNTASGNNALYNCTGSNNTAIGYQAGDTITTGGNNLYLGYDADASAAGVTNETAIGYQATGMGYATISFGSSAITANYFRGAIAYATYQEADTAVINSIFFDDDDYKLKAKNNAGTVIDLTATSGFASADITGQTEKTTLADDDLFVIADSADSFALKKAKKVNVGGGGEGDVAGPASSVDNQATRFDGITGKLLQASSLYIDDDGGIRMPEDMTTPATPASGTLKLYGQGSQFYSMDDAGITRKLAGEWTLVERKTFASDGTSYAFTGLNGDADVSYKIKARVLVNSATDVLMYANADTTAANYATLLLRSVGPNNAPTTLEWNNTAGMGLTYGIVANKVTNINAEIYLKTDGQYRILQGRTVNICAEAGDYNLDSHLQHAAIWKNVADNVTSLTVTGNWKTGTVFELWKLAQ